MKTTQTLIPAIFAAIILSTATISYAGDDAQAQDKHEAHMQERLDRMKTELSLTDKQVAQIKALQESYMAKRKAEREAMRKEMDAILTPEQRKKAEEMRKARKAKFMERHGDPGEE